MSRQSVILVLIGLLLVALLLACGDKLTLPELPAAQYTGVDTSYVQINPTWTEAGGIPYSHPWGIYVGYDRYIYVCDTDNNRIVKLDVSGVMVESYPIMHPVAVTQDRGLDLLAVCGDYHEVVPISETENDTTWYGNSVYRRSYIHSGDFQPAFTDSTEIAIYVFPPGIYVYTMPEYWGIAASLDPTKEYYLADNLHDRILMMTSDDTPELGPFVSSGIGIGLTTSPWTLYTYQIVGQEYLAYAQAAANLGVQILSLPAGKPIYADTVAGLPDMVRIHTSVRKWVAVDELSNYYVLLQKLTPLLGYNYHLIKYDRDGNFLLEFGTDGSGEKQFNQPSGLAYKDGIIYISDTYNNRILRFQLSTQIQQ
jgi:hypothetical protein